MRSFLMASAAGLLLSVGAAGVANAANPNVPTWSPYTVMAVPGSVPEVTPTANPQWAYARDSVEGRSAYVEQRPYVGFPGDLFPWNW